MWRIFKTAHGKVETFRKGRVRQTDDDFLVQCGLSKSEWREDALAVRRAVAHLGLIDPLLIHASDRFPEDLSELPVWDSMDWLTLYFEIEYQLGRKVSWANSELELRHSFTVRDLVVAALEAIRVA